VWTVAAQLAHKEIIVAQSSPQVFIGITPAQYANLTQKARSAGIQMNGNSGRASKMGVEVEWHYSPERQELTLTCLHTPFFMSVDDVNTKLHTLVSDSLEA
jgi:hypothetical protein